ncbi:MAG: hypothetical protein AAB227_12285, partial [Pseudomonadota bacterium]
LPTTGPSMVVQALHLLVVVREVRRQDLEGDELVGFEIVGLKDDAAVPLPQRGADFVTVTKFESIDWRHV